MEDDCVEDERSYTDQTVLVLNNRVVSSAVKVFEILDRRL